MTLQRHVTVVGVFEDRGLAQHAVIALKRAGFRDDQIGVAGRGHEAFRSGDHETSASYAGEGAVTGLAAGAGIGALWGLGIMAGVLPAIGPAIAGGTLAAILSSAAAGAAAAGLAGSLVGMGIPHEDAEYYESEFQAGRTILTVHAAGREEEAAGLMRQFGGYDSARRNEVAKSTPADHMTGAGFSSTAQHTGNVESGHRTLDVPIRTDDLLSERDPLGGSRYRNPNE
jgi:hypothetical protein